MKLGLRLQTLMLLGVLLTLAFIPLYFAISTYTEVAIAAVKRDHAETLARAVAQQVNLEQTSQGLSESIARALRIETVRRIEVRNPDGTTRLRQEVSGADRAKSDAQGRAWAQATIHSPTGSVTCAVAVGTGGARQLNQLLGLYMGLVALALLVGTHFTMTRWIIKPVGELSRAAQKVATTTKELSVPRTSSLELTELGESLRTMTRRFLNDEQSLRKKVDEVELATVQLKDAQAQLVRSERLASVGQLAAGLAHEVGNPIAAMQGMADLLIEGGLEEDQQLDFIQRIRKETERISSILRDLLQFARPEQRGVGDPTSAGNVEAAVTETITLLAPQPTFRDVDIALDVYPDLPLVTLSHDQLTQVLLNLLMNAGHACNDSGEVRVTVTTAERRVIVTVEDSGPGVPPELVDRIFEPFVSTKDVGEGTGLGLAVCKGLIEGVGGTISVDLSYSDGARFVVELPVASFDD